jgi:hypothetical protein
MKFPQWVGKGDTTRVASNRLRYMLMQVAVECEPKESMAAVARKAGISRQLLHQGIQRGSFSAKTASLIEQKLGRDVIRKEHLVFPLAIEVTE